MDSNAGPGRGATREAGAQHVATCCGVPCVASSAASRIG